MKKLNNFVSARGGCAGAFTKRGPNFNLDVGAPSGYPKPSKASTAVTRKASSSAGPISAPKKPRPCVVRSLFFCAAWSLTLDASIYCATDLHSYYNNHIYLL